MQELAVSHAFHSKQMEPMCGRVLRGVQREWGMRERAGDADFRA